LSLVIDHFGFSTIVTREEYLEIANRRWASIESLKGTMTIIICWLEACSLRIKTYEKNAELRKKQGIEALIKLTEEVKLSTKTIQKEKLLN
jgi:hypothetical protein